MTRNFDREIERGTAPSRLRKGELAAAVDDARGAIALSLKAAGKEEAFDAVNSAIDEAVAGARLPARIPLRPYMRNSVLTYRTAPP